MATYNEIVDKEVVEVVDVESKSGEEGRAWSEVDMVLMTRVCQPCGGIYVSTLFSSHILTWPPWIYCSKYSGIVNHVGWPFRNVCNREGVFSFRW
jgi:hypothetical protein